MREQGTVFMLCSLVVFCLSNSTLVASYTRNVIAEVNTKVEIQCIFCYYVLTF